MSRESKDNSKKDRDPNSHFQKLKSICLPLLYSAPDAPPIPPSLSRTISPVTSVQGRRQLFSHLAELIGSIDASEFTPAFANYVWFPLSQYLRSPNLPDQLLEGVLVALRDLSLKWIECADGMDDEVFRQLFIFGVIKLKASSLEGNEKGKGRELPEETKVYVVQFLSGLIWAAGSKLPQLSEVLQVQFIDSVLNLIRFSQTLELRMEAIHLFSQFLPSLNYTFLLSVLAGVASTLAAAVLNVPTLSIGADETQSQSRPFNSEFSSRCLAVFEDVLQSLPTYEAADESRDQWTAPLSRTIHHLVSSLRESDRPNVRQALSSFATSILIKTSGFLATYSPNSSDALELRKLLVETVLILSMDDFMDVNHPCVVFLQENANSNTDLLSIAQNIVSDALDMIPLLLYRKDSGALIQATKIVRAGVVYIPFPELEEIGPKEISRQQRWLWGILRALESSRMARTVKSLNDGLTIGLPLDIRRWETRFKPQVFEENGMEIAVEQMIVSMAENSDSKVFHGLSLHEVVEKYWAISQLEFQNARKLEGQNLGSAIDELQLASRALWMVEKLAGGMSQKQKKRVRRWIPSILEMLEPRDGTTEMDVTMRNSQSLEDDDIGKMISKEEMEEMEVEWKSYHEPSNTLHTKRPPIDFESIPVIFPRNPSKSPQVLRYEDDRLIMNALSVLVRVSSILGPSFRTELISALYPVLRHQASMESSSSLGLHAEESLEKIARNVGYISTKELLEDNVDYIIEGASSRLLPSFGGVGTRGMDLDAPLVLVLMLKKVGTTATVEMMRDVVEDGLQLLDDYHAYDAVTARLWLLLDTVVEVVSKDLPLTPSKRIASTGAWTDNDSRSQLVDFEMWLQQEEPKTHTDEDLNVGNGPLDASSFHAPGLEDEYPAPSEECKPQSTKSQQVIVSILSRTPYFLSHDSPTLRARLLSLLASTVSILSAPETERELLPLIHTCWPYILNRISAKEEPFVLQQAMKLIQELSEWTGDFMTQRISDDAWPRFKKLLEEKENQRPKRTVIKAGSSLVPRWQIGMLKTVKAIVKGTKVSEEVRWDMTVFLRQFLDEDEEPIVQEAAVELYKELFIRNSSGVWLALEGSSKSSELPDFLKLERVNISNNVLKIVTQ